MGPKYAITLLDLSMDCNLEDKEPNQIALLFDVGVAGLLGNCNEYKMKFYCTEKSFLFVFLI